MLRTIKPTLKIAWFAASLLLVPALRAQEPLRDATPEQFAALQKLIKPHAGESRWMEIAWLPSVWEARQKAAAEGKPLFLWAGSGGAPSVNC